MLGTSSLKRRGEGTHNNVVGLIVRVLRTINVARAGGSDGSEETQASVKDREDEKLDVGGGGLFAVSREVTDIDT